MSTAWTSPHALEQVDHHAPARAAIGFKGHERDNSRNPRPPTCGKVARMLAGLGGQSNATIAVAWELG